jgi:hypothetical protein
MCVFCFTKHWNSLSTFDYKWFCSELARFLDYIKVSFEVNLKSDCYRSTLELVFLLMLLSLIKTNSWWWYTFNEKSRLPIPPSITFKYDHKLKIIFYACKMHYRMLFVCKCTDFHKCNTFYGFVEMATQLINIFQTAIHLRHRYLIKCVQMSHKLYFFKNNLLMIKI